jgi:hypothetical protein
VFAIALPNALKNSNMSKKSKMQLLLEAPFRQLAKDRRENNELPAELRRDIFRTLDMIDLSEDGEGSSFDESDETTKDFMESIENPDDEATADGTYYMEEPTDEPTFDIKEMDDSIDGSEAESYDS